MTTGACVTVESPFSAEAAALLEELDRDLLDRYPRHNIHGVALHELDREQGIFVVARLDSPARRLRRRSLAGAGRR